MHNIMAKFECIAIITMHAMQKDTTNTNEQPTDRPQIITYIYTYIAFALYILKLSCKYAQHIERRKAPLILIIPYCLRSKRRYVVVCTHVIRVLFSTTVTGTHRFAMQSVSVRAGGCETAAGQLAENSDSVPKDCDEL